MKNKTLDDLIMYVYKRYTYPKSWWTQVHKERRCTEIYASEQAILRCMENPTMEPKEVIFDYIMSVEACRKDATNDKVIKIMNLILITLNTLYDYF